jgi:hypothetical protein
MEYDRHVDQDEEAQLVQAQRRECYGEDYE